MSMSFSDVEQKSIIVHSPAFGRDKIGRVPQGQADALPPDTPLDHPPAYSSTTLPSSSSPYRQSTPRASRQDLRAAQSISEKQHIYHDSDASSIVSLGDGIQASPDDSPLRSTRMEKPVRTLDGQQQNSLYEPQTSSHSQARTVDVPPTPPPKDRAPLDSPASAKSSNTTPFNFFSQGNDSTSYFPRPSHSRSGSVYSLSRISFSNQISQLTSIKLPAPSTLASSISSISTSTKAARALTDASDQIQGWIQKASDVLEGLNAEDDVEWAAAAGREGLHEVDRAISTFESLIDIYVTSAEHLQTREDASKVAPQDLQRVADLVELTTKSWSTIKASLKQVKEQVELAIEWQGIRDTVISETEQEIDSLSRLVFELEEKRHSVVTTPDDGHVGVDLVELETIMEEPSGRVPKINRLAPIATAIGSPSRASTATAHENSELLGLYARMQPLRASLDFVPMRLATFRTHAGHVFPTACSILDQDQELLEERYKKLEADADSLRRELGEDRWVLVFKNAGKQALRMIDSVARSIKKVDESLDADTKLRHAPSTVRKIESYEAKKLHYCPAIERVLSIVDRGVADRLTVNGEILRLQADLRKRWQNLGHDMKNMDAILEEYEGLRNQQLRDSLSSILSSEKSLASSAIITPGSSPASSVGMLSRKSSQHEPSQDEPSSPLLVGKSRASSGTRSTATTERRMSSLPVPIVSSSIPKRSPNPLSQLGLLSVSTPKTPMSARRMSSSITPTSARSTTSVSSSKPEDRRPRWNGSTRVNHSDYNFKPLSAYEPSPYAKKPLGPFPRTVPSRRTSSSLLSSSSTSTPGTLGSRPSKTHLSSSPLSQKPVFTPKSSHMRTPGSASSARADHLAVDAPASPSPAGQSSKNRTISVSSATSNVSIPSHSRLRNSMPPAEAAAPRPSTPANRPTTAGSSGTEKHTPSFIPQPLTHRVPGHASPEAIAAAVRALSPETTRR